MPLQSSTQLARSAARCRLFFSVALFAAALAGGLPARTASAASAAVAASSPHCPDTVTVTNGNDAGAGTLRQAVADVCAGGTITFANDMTVWLTGELVVSKSLTIEGQEKQVTISGGRRTRIFAISSGALTLNRLTVIDGYAGDLNGGAIMMADDATLVVDSCLLTNNATNANGGAIYGIKVYLTVKNSTLTGNSAGDTGGAIYYGGNMASQYNTLTLQNVTIAGNSATSAGGVGSSWYNGMSATNTIIAQQLTGGNCSYEFAAGSHNLSNTSSCGSQFARVNSVLFGTLGDYGGVTRAVPLLPGSPAIDAGAGCLNTDQRQFPRFGTCDIGAFESQGFALSVIGGDNQSTAAGTDFLDPLSVSVAPNQPSEPVNGGQVTFAPPTAGASAVVDGSPAGIGDGSASVALRANDVKGRYAVTASARGATNATFNLTNLGPNAVQVSRFAAQPAPVPALWEALGLVGLAFALPGWRARCRRRRP